MRYKRADGTIKEYRYPSYRIKRKERFAPNSLSALIKDYQRSPEWAKLSASSRKNYDHYLKPLDAIGLAPAKDVTRRHILSLRDQIARQRGDGAAAGFVRAASALFTWAMDRTWLDANPAARGKRGLSRGTLPAWDTEQASTAMRVLPEHLRRVVVLAAYTGQRRGDLCSMMWSAYDGEMLRVKQQKTKVSLVLQVHPSLKVELDGWRSNATSTHVLVNQNGQPWQGNKLSMQLPRALARIGFPSGYNIHGLRKFIAAQLANRGASIHEIAAITGHKSLEMIRLYTASAEQERLATSAMQRLQTGFYKTRK